jgi:ribokinase
VAHVACVGDLMVDVLARLPAPLATGSDTPAPVLFRGGGAAGNVAAWLVAAGSASSVIGVVGDDAAGRDVVTGLQADGVDARVSVDPARPTGCCIVLVDPSGERTMIPSAGANAGLGELDPTAALPPEVDALYVSGYALLEPGSRPFALSAMTWARQRGCPVAVDVASAAPLARAGTAAVAAWIGGDVLLFANDDEAEVLTGRRGEAAARVLADSYGEAVVKHGAAGATWARDTALVHAGAEPATVVDTTGAGDAFAAGFLHARLGGAGPAGCLQAGATLAARAIAAPGGRPPRRNLLKS